MKSFMSFQTLTLVVCALALAACGTTTTPTAVVPPATGAATMPQAGEPTLSPSVLFRIVKPDGSQVGVSLADMKGLASAQITVEGKIEEGPKLSDVLALAGVTDFVEVTLEGSASPATLTRAQVDDNTLLDFTNRGTVKLATTYIAKPDWAKDITLITVK